MNKDTIHSSAESLEARSRDSVREMDISMLKKLRSLVTQPTKDKEKYDKKKNCMECLVGTRVQTTQSINEGLLDSVPKLRLCLVIFHMCKIMFFLLLKITEINIENDAIIYYLIAYTVYTRI